MNTKRSRLLEARVAQLKKKIAEQRRINEVLATPYEFAIRATRDAIRAGFTTTSGHYRYQMEIQPMYIDGDIVMVGDVAFADEAGEIRITGKGDAFRTLATVLEITKKAANDKQAIAKFVRNMIGDDVENIPDHVEVLTFSAEPDEPSRFRLYQRLSKNAPGYTLARIRRGLFILVSDRMDPDKRKKVIDALG